MSAKKLVFIDTNILIYRSFGTEAQKRIIQKLLVQHAGNIFISAQVLNEFINASLKKRFFETEEELDETLNYFLANFNCIAVEVSTISKAIEIRRKHKLSHYDSVIVASALENSCEVLYTQDMHHGLRVTKTLKISNPFK